jgi:hypothetical protein
MKKMFALFVALAVFEVSLNAQDIITKSNGEELKVKVLEVTQNEVKYKRFDQQDGPIFTISKSEIFMLKYQNGSKDIFSESTNSNNSEANKNDMSQKGKDDAKTFYKGKNSGAGWTSAATIVLSPVLGVIPAAICASNEPSDENLNAPNEKLMKNNDYNNAYTEQAHKTKKKKIWKSFGISSGIWVAIILLL